MHAIPRDDRSEVIERIRQYAMKRMGGDEVGLYLPLVDRYHERVAVEDLAARAVPDLFGTWLAHQRLARRRQPGQAQRGGGLADQNPAAVNAATAAPAPSAGEPGGAPCPGQRDHGEWK